jgi:hypothetical protein
MRERGVLSVVVCRFNVSSKARTAPLYHNVASNPNMLRFLRLRQELVRTNQWN